MKLFIGLFCAGLAVIFILQNAAVVDVQFLVWTVSLSRALLMFILLALGIVIGWILNGVMRLRREKLKSNPK